jgi:hypothetical protein
LFRVVLLFVKNLSATTSYSFGDRLIRYFFLFENERLISISNSHFGGGDGEEEGRERAKKDWKLRG